MAALKFAEKILSVTSEPFKALDLKILQVNLGYLCNMACKHCHVYGGPTRTEIMNARTVEKVVRVFLDNPFEILDITGGAPEMNPSFLMLIKEVSREGRCVMIRTNLTIFSEDAMAGLPEIYRDQKVELIASLPYYIEDGVDGVRGGGAFKKSIIALRRLNELGFGRESSGLRLNLVYNPQGMFLTPDQKTLEAEYKRELQRQFGIVFNSLYIFANMPIGRFRDYLARTGNLEKYTQKLSGAFNPAALDGVMCRHLVSVGWDGKLYDCDFNQALDLSIDSAAPRHIDVFDYEALLKRKISVGEHCYACTAGQGSS